MVDMLFKIGYSIFVSVVIALALLLLISIIPIPGNIEMKIVQSGSMEPAIHTGSAVIIKPLESYTEGDIITFYFNRGDETPTTHRIIEVREAEGAISYLTKGDANENEDPQPVSGTSVVGKVLFSIPYLGYVLDYIKKPVGFLLVIGVPAALIIFDEIGKIWGEIRTARRKDTEEKAVSDSNHV